MKNNTLKTVNPLDLAVFIIPQLNPNPLPLYFLDH